MIQISIIVSNKLGLHARASAKLVELCSGYVSKIIVENNCNFANGKSIMSLMMLSANYGSLLNISCDGDDENTAIEQIKCMFENKFGEYE